MNGHARSRRASPHVTWCDAVSQAVTPHYIMSRQDLSCFVTPGAAPREPDLRLTRSARWPAGWTSAASVPAGTSTPASRRWSVLAPGCCCWLSASAGWCSDMQGEGSGSEFPGATDPRGRPAMLALSGMAGVGSGRGRNVSD